MCTKEHLRLTRSWLLSLHVFWPPLPQKSFQEKPQLYVICDKSVFLLKSRIQFPSERPENQTQKKNLFFPFKFMFWYAGRGWS